MRAKPVKSGQWKVVAACRDSGKCELLDFLKDVPENMQAWKDGILLLMARAANDPMGPKSLSKEVCHDLGDGIWEFIRGRLRVLWFEHEGHVVVCTHGFVKKSQKTPASEIDRAKRVRSRVETEGLDIEAAK
jgi:phage-related protein